MERVRRNPSPTITTARRTTSVSSGWSSIPSNKDHENHPAVITLAVGPTSTSDSYPPSTDGPKNGGMPFASTTANTLLAVGMVASAFVLCVLVYSWWRYFQKKKQNSWPSESKSRGKQSGRDEEGIGGLYGFDDDPGLWGHGNSKERRVAVPRTANPALGGNRGTWAESRLPSYVQQLNRSPTDKTKQPHPPVTINLSPSESIPKDVSKAPPSPSSFLQLPGVGNPGSGQSSARSSIISDWENYLQDSKEDGGSNGVQTKQIV